MTQEVHPSSTSKTLGCDAVVIGVSLGKPAALEGR
jgi:hypothetical protein